jgi:GTPase SAR1 family protein
MSDSSIRAYQPPRQGQLADELRFAVGRTPPSELACWGKRSARRFVSVGVKRVTGFGSLLVKITTLSADELVRAISAWNTNNLGAYAQGRVEKVEKLATLLAERGRSAFELAAENIESRPSEAATHLLAAVVGFYSGSGGDGDGGVPDLDLLAGIGAHRSIFTHSIIAGTFIETAVMSLVDLIQVVHARLPERHSEFWDVMSRHVEIGGSTFVSSASIGIATHLGIDTLVDGFTPYKDLPIELPQFAHELLMGLNAGAEGVHGVRRYGEDLLRPSGRARKSEPLYVGASVIGSTKCRDSNQQLPGTENKMVNLTNGPGTTFPNDQLASVMDLAERVRRSLGIDVSAVHEAVEVARERIGQASGPFCLGVVGEFRVGKSTLINALMGQEIAFTDFMEATPVICRFVKGTRLGATLLFKDGRADSMTVEECNSILDECRHDKGWVSSIVRVEYQVPTDTLDSFDLWDAPGLGGSEENDLIAQRYTGMLGGAIWVVDATLVGRASIADPIMRMHADGKPLVCVLNRIDETEEDPQILRNWVAGAYPGVFSDIVTFSAQAALDSAANGIVSYESRSLWDVIKKAIGKSADAGNATRTTLTASNAKKLVAARLNDLRREIQDRIGALDHFCSGLSGAKKRTLQAVSGHLEQRAESAFKELVARVEGELAKSNWSPSSIDKIVSLLSDSKMLSEISRRIAEEALALANQTWVRVSNESLALSAAAVPMDDLVPYYKFGRSPQAEDTQAVHHGVYVGGMTAIAAGTIAAISTIVTWPVILAAVPVGALATWKKRKDLGASESEFMAQITALVERMRVEYVERVHPEIVSRVEVAIQEQIERYLADKRGLLLGGTDSMGAANICDDVQSICEALHSPEGAEPRTEWSGAEILDLLGNPGSRLDIVTQDLDFSLSSVLSELPASTEIRLIFNAKGRGRDELEKQVANAFENWQGRKRVKSISAEHEVHLITLLMTQDRCLVSDKSLGHLLEYGTTFRDFVNGRLAGQQLFAGLWEGSFYMGDPIQASPVH